jgi:hypothetical protein
MDKKRSLSEFFNENGYQFGSGGTIYSASISFHQLNVIMPPPSPGPKSFAAQYSNL